MTNEIVTVDNKFYKECEVIALKAKKGTAALHQSVLYPKLFQIGDNKVDNHNWQGLHLYILSTEEIKEGDWVVYNNMISQTKGFKSEKRMINLSTNNGWFNTSNCKKIIASIDKALTIPVKSYEEYNGGNIGELPRPSNEFLKAYCEQGGIDKVLVEMIIDKYDERNQYEDIPTGKYWGDTPRAKSPDVLYTNADYYIPKVAPDNTITIKKAEDKLITLRDMHLNMQYYMEYCQAKGYVTPQEWLANHKHF